MKFTAVKIAATDNVVTVLRDIKKGETVTYANGDSVCEVVALENIPVYHKIALQDLPIDAEIIKYGESLGKLTANVKKGSWVAHHNLKSQSRNYDEELEAIK